ncbi:Alpha-glucuronidase [Paludibacter propionicigenes WB4]|uniref:Alpha-glucuronidase n=2 Tax=Paludibacter TaxID=346096 RepID=E4T4Z1_PALPW|nr:Alpha-glucuronidase [Paludibacter propionicigenes WB4]
MTANKNMKYSVLGLILMCISPLLHAEDGHSLWLRNKGKGSVNVVCSKNSPTLALAKQELREGWSGNAGATVNLILKTDKALKADGFKLKENQIQANTESGILYGVYELLRRQQTGEVIKEETINPSYERRILNHWDNPNGTIERGYAGRSIFWRPSKDSLGVTEKDKTLWTEYARANASVGINGAVLDNVNADQKMLTAPYLERVKGIADILRPYGVKTYLSVKFSSPSMIGGLKTSDPLNPEVIKWWKDKVKEIYKIIPDFGGFLVKANSEGQPGPQDYKRTHADGANMMADALKPYGGIVMWRAFVYSTSDEDRAKQAYGEFMPLDGQFRDNVIIQVKNGPVDFQPREPFSPLFGAMKKTSVMPEVQITQEYLGHSTHLVYLAPMWEEFLKSDTYQAGVGSTVARCTDGSVYSQKHTAIAGVSNIGLDTNWCGHDFAQSNWYAFGRLAWDNKLTSEQIADEWIKLTFRNEGAESADWNNNFLKPVKEMMLLSREAAVNYMMPLGLHHIMSANEHYGPGPWWAPARTRKDWTPPYFHKADLTGVGFDRSKTGSNAVSQYHEPLASQLNDINTCPAELLLWFHHTPWNFKLKTGRTLWDEMCYKYDTGVKQVRQFQKTWDKIEPYVDADRFTRIQNKLRAQSQNAQVWKDACLLYFQQFSKMPIPYDIERPVNNLDDLIKNDMKRR